MVNNENVNKLVGSRIKEARTEKGLSQTDLAKAIGYESATAISLIEAGERKLRVEDLQTMSSALDRDVKYFLGQESEMPTVNIALRADPDLSPKDKETLLHFIDLAKKKRDGRNNP